MIQKQKGFSAPVLALSVWTAALAEEMQTGISPRGMIIHGAVQALLLTCISGVFSACWQRQPCSGSGCFPQEHGFWQSCLEP